jgi:hypothetical protein
MAPLGFISVSKFALAGLWRLADLELIQILMDFMPLETGSPTSSGRL